MPLNLLKKDFFTHFQAIRANGLQALMVYNANDVVVASGRIVVVGVSSVQPQYVGGEDGLGPERRQSRGSRM